MKVKNFLPNFDGQVSTIRRDAEMELFLNLYNEKAANMDQVRVLNFYGPTGAGKAWVMKALYKIQGYY